MTTDAGSILGAKISMVLEEVTLEYLYQSGRALCSSTRQAKHFRIKGGTEKLLREKWCFINDVGVRHDEPMLYDLGGDVLLVA